jgi:hypothetical protein
MNTYHRLPFGFMHVYKRLVLRSSDDGMTTFYELMPDIGTATHISHSGSLTRSALRYDAGATGIGLAVRSVTVRFIKTGSPVGNVTINTRNAADTVTATIGTFNIASIGPAGTEIGYAVRLRPNAVTLAQGDRVTIEYASSGLDVTTHSTASNPIQNATSQTFSGSYSNSADPLCISVKGF